MDHDLCNIPVHMYENFFFSTTSGNELTLRGFKFTWEGCTPRGRFMYMEHHYSGSDLYADEDFF